MACFFQHPRYFIIHAPSVLKPLDENSVMTDVSLMCEAFWCICLHLEMPPAELVSTSHEDGFYIQENSEGGGQGCSDRSTTLISFFECER